MESRIRLALEFTQAHCAEHLTVSLVAAQVGLSRSRFEHLFRAETGRRFKPALRQVRLSESQSLLARSELRIKEIAYRVGFRSAWAFSRAFRKVYGQPASQWRRRHSQVGIARLDNT